MCKAEGNQNCPCAEFSRTSWRFIWNGD